VYFAAAFREQPRRFHGHGHGSSGGWVRQQIRRAENGLLKTNDKSECGSGCAMLWRRERKIGICKAIVRLLGGQSVRKPPGGRRCAHRVKISVGVIVSAKTCHPRPLLRAGRRHSRHALAVVQKQGLPAIYRICTTPHYPYSAEHHNFSWYCDRRNQIPKDGALSRMGRPPVMSTSPRSR
jgi:hypothetical protein